MSVWKMAWRNVWRNRRRTVATVGAMSLALLVMILYSGIVQGYLVRMRRNILDLELGDLQLHAVDYRNDPSIYTMIEAPEPLLAALDKAGYPASARLLASGLAAAGDSSAGVGFIGVDVERDARVSDVHKHVAEGTWLDPAAPTGVVIGRRLARTLNVGLGDELVVLSQAADGSMANDLYQVRGVLKSIGDAVDRSGVFMTDTAFRELFVFAEGAHRIIVRKPAAVELSAAEAEIKGLAAGLEVKTWRQLMPTLSSMMDSVSSVMYTMFLIIYLAIGILILNAMLMAVFERIREFGVIKALGVGPGGVLRLILTESAIQTAVALLVGGLLSIPSNWYLVTEGLVLTGLGGLTVHGIAFDPVWRSVVTTETYTGPVFTLVFIVAVAVLYPAIKAARIRPVEAIRHQ
jgi:ABC-type lipoprotein release transport system permease subunit